MIQFRSGFMFLVLMLLLLTAAACKEGFTNDGGDNPGGDSGPLYTVSGVLVDDGFKSFGDVHSNFRFARMGIYNSAGEKEKEIQADYFGRFSLSLSEGTYFLYISEMGSHMDVPFPLAMRVLPGGKINSSGFSLLMNVEFDNPAYVIASKSECGAEVSEYNKFYQYAYMNNRVAMETVYEGATSSSASLDERNTYDYSTEGNLISHTYDSSSGTSNDYYCEFIYEDGRLISKKKYEEVLTPDPVSLYYTITYDYDANGKVESSSFDRTDGTTYDKYFEYRYRGDLLISERKYENGTSDAADLCYTRTYIYDDEDNLIAYIDDQTYGSTGTESDNYYEYLYENSFIKTKWDYSGGTTPWGNLNEVMTYTCNENGLITEIVEDSVSGSDSFTALSYNESGLLSTFARYAGLDSSGTFGGKYVVEYNSDKFMTLVFFISSDTNYCYEFVYDGDTLSGQNTYEASTPADDKLGAAVNYTWEETD